MKLVAVSPRARRAGGASFLARVFGNERDRAVEDVATRLRALLSPEHAVLADYLPRDPADGPVDLVVVGPSGVFVAEVRDTPGDLVCYQDVWYRCDPRGMSRLPDSPSRVARWNGTRLLSDVSSVGFYGTAVSAVLVLTAGHALDARSSCVPVLDGLDAFAAHVSRGRRVLDPGRARSLADALLA